MAEVRSEHTVHTLLRLTYHWQIGSIILGIVLIMQQSNFPRVVGLPRILLATQTGVQDSHLSMRTSCTVLFGYNQWRRGSNKAPEVLDSSHLVLSTLTGKEDDAYIHIHSPPQSVLTHSKLGRERKQVPSFGLFSPLCLISMKSQDLFNALLLPGWQRICQLQRVQMFSDAHQKPLLKPTFGLISTRWPQISISAKFC